MLTLRSTGPRLIDEFPVRINPKFTGHSSLIVSIGIDLSSSTLSMQSNELSRALRSTGVDRTILAAVVSIHLALE